MYFLVANATRPDGTAFAKRHGVRDGTLLLFSADWDRLVEKGAEGFGKSVCRSRFGSA